MLKPAVFAAVVLVAALPSPVQHEHYRRTVTVAENDGTVKQAYFAVPADTFLQSRTDLGDLRLMAAANEVPYLLRVEEANTGEPVEMKSRLLNLGGYGRGVRFTVEVTDGGRATSPYNRLNIELTKGTSDFIATVHVSGSEENAGAAVDLGTHRIFKLDAENVPAHTEVEIGPSNFRYLRVAIEGKLEARNIRGATIEANAAHGAEWSSVDAVPRVETLGKVTVVSFVTSNRYPVAAMQFAVERSRENFDRSVKIFADEVEVGSFRLRRTTIKRDGEALDSEEGRAVFPATGANRYRAEIDNGDDPPLQISGVDLEMVQRRVYFDPKENAKLMLYYGDDKTAPPVYEYGRLHEADSAAKIATVGPEEHNPEFQSRPDMRPWTEQHPALLKAALGLVVVVLGSLALLSIKPRE